MLSLHCISTCLLFSLKIPLSEQNDLVSKSSSNFFQTLLFRFPVRSQRALLYGWRFWGR